MSVSFGVIIMEKRDKLIHLRPCAWRVQADRGSEEEDEDVAGDEECRDDGRALQAMSML